MTRLFNYKFNTRNKIMPITKTEVKSTVTIIENTGTNKVLVFSKGLNNTVLDPKQKMKIIGERKVKDIFARSYQGGDGNLRITVSLPFSVVK